MYRISGLPCHNGRYILYSISILYVVHVARISPFSSYEYLKNNLLVYQVFLFFYSSFHTDLRKIFRYNFYLEEYSYFFFKSQQMCLCNHVDTFTGKPKRKMEIYLVRMLNSNSYSSVFNDLFARIVYFVKYVNTSNIQIGMI